MAALDRKHAEVAVMKQEHRQVLEHSLVWFILINGRLVEGLHTGGAMVGRRSRSDSQPYRTLCSLQPAPGNKPDAATVLTDRTKG